MELSWCLKRQTSTGEIKRHPAQLLRSNYNMILVSNMFSVFTFSLLCLSQILRMMGLILEVLQIGIVKMEDEVEMSIIGIVECAN